MRKFKKNLRLNNLKEDFSNIHKKKVNLINVDYKEKDPFFNINTKNYALTTKFF